MRRLLFQIGLITCLGLSTAQAQEARQFSTQVGTPVSEAAELLRANSHAEGLAKLDQALAISDITAFEKSSIEQMRGAALYQLDRHRDSITAFETAINAGGLSAAEVQSLNLQIAQIKIGLEDFIGGATMLEAYARQGGDLSPKHIEILIQAWIKAERYEKSLPWAKQLFDSAQPKERRHYDLMNFHYHQLKQTTQQADIVMQMIQNWPDDKSLWENWASLEAASGDDSAAFEVKKLMYEQGLISTETEISQLVQYHGYYEIPYWGAKLLDREMIAGRVAETPENLKNLANLWRQAREYKRAIPVLEKAAKLAGDKPTYAALAEALVNQNSCAQAEDAFISAIDQGYGPAKPWMLIGTCRYEAAQLYPKPSCSDNITTRWESDRYKAQNHAIKAFEKVTHNRKLEADAQKWTSFIKAEQKALEDRCDFIAKERWLVCQTDIKQAYNNIIFNKEKFVLNDKACLDFKDRYDTHYRPGRDNQVQLVVEINSRP